MNENVLHLTSELLGHSIFHLNAAADKKGVSCKLCQADTLPFDMVDFNKSCSPVLYPLGLSGIPVIYHQCTSCGFIFTNFFDSFDSDQWQRHVYNEEYVKVDPEYIVIRPQSNVVRLTSFLSGWKGLVGLDYGGGNGLTSRLLRETGLVYDSYDPYGHIDAAEDRFGKYNFCSAIEVFEHLPDPAGSLATIADMCSKDELVIFIGTSVHDNMVSPETRLAWWYAAPRNGHVSLYSKNSLRILGMKYGLEYVSLSPVTHLLTRGVKRGKALSLLAKLKLLDKCRRVFKR